MSPNPLALLWPQGQRPGAGPLCCSICVHARPEKQLGFSRTFGHMIHSSFVELKRFVPARP